MSPSCSNGNGAVYSFYSLTVQVGVRLSKKIENLQALQVKGKRAFN